MNIVLDFFLVLLLTLNEFSTKTQPISLQFFAFKQIN